MSPSAMKQMSWLSGLSATRSPRAAASARTLGFGMLDGSFREWLATLVPTADADERRAAWQSRAHEIIRNLGRDLVNSAGDAAWEGRVIQTRKGQEVWLDASRASLTFRSRFTKALPGAAQNGQSTENDQILEVRP